jgi:putative phosphoesterase
MRILIISDSHDNVANLEKILKWANENNIKEIVHAGDVSAPGVVVKTLSPMVSGKMHLIFGNVGDKELLEQVCAKTDNIKYYGDIGGVEFENKKIAFVHFKAKADELANTGKYNLVVFGHSHQSEIYKIGDTQVVNPGTAGGLYNRASFAVYDTDNEEVDIIFLDELS